MYWPEFWFDPASFQIHKEANTQRHNLKYYKRTETEDIPIPFGSDILRVGNGILSRNKIEYSDAKKLPKTSESEVFNDYKVDFTGDGIADVASCWDNGLWYQDGSTLGWTKISDSAPNQVTAGDVTGD